MNQEEFQQFLQTEPDLKAVFDDVADKLPTNQQTFGTPVELAAIAILFPVAQFVVVRVGLPWLYEAGRYSELWRLKFHRWIDEQYAEHGINPEAAEAAGEELRKKLESTTEAGVKAAWERFQSVLKKEEE